MRGEQHCFHGFNPGRLQPISMPDPQRYTIELRDADCPPEHFHDTKTTYHVIADSRPHATLTISLLSECHCNVIRFTDITPLEDIESGTDHPTDLDADPKQVNAYQIFREASFQITIPATGTGRISPLSTHSPKPETSTTITRPKTPPEERSRNQSTHTPVEPCSPTLPPSAISAGAPYRTTSTQHPLTYPRTSPEKQTRSKPLRRSRNPRSDSVFQLNSSPRSTVTNTPIPPMNIPSPNRSVLND